MPIIESSPAASETITIGNTNAWSDAINQVRGMITVAMGCLKELSSQAVMKYRAPGMRFLIGEIMSCLAQAKKASDIKPEAFNFKRV